MRAGGQAGTAVLAALGALAPTAAMAAEPPGPAWTLRSLGRPALDMPVAQAVEEQSVAFEAPPGTRQGAGRWYLARLDFALELDPGSGDGLVYLSLLTNGRASVMVKLQTSRRAGRLRVRWSTVDLLHGRREHVTTSPSIAATADNFLQDSGLRPGSNSLSFRLERYGRARVRAARVLEDSGVVSSLKGPARLRLEVPVRDRRLRVGDEFSLPYRVRNVGDRAPEWARISVQFDEHALTAVGPTTHRLDPRAAKSEGAFRFRARRAGRSDVFLSLDSTANHPGAQVSVRIDPPSAAPAGVRAWKALGGAGLVLLAAAAIVGLAPHRRRTAERVRA